LTFRAGKAVIHHAASPTLIQVSRSLVWLYQGP